MEVQINYGEILFVHDSIIFFICYSAAKIHNFHELKAGLWKNLCAGSILS